MTNITAKIYKDIEDNDLDKVIFQDPFSEVTRKAKRNLMIASFVGLLIAVLKLEITGFLGLQASKLVLGNELAQGLVCAVIIYALVSFIFHVYIDYSAWQYKQERQLTKPYIELIQVFRNHIQITGNNIENATDRLRNVNSDKEMQDQINLNQAVSYASSSLDSINKHIQSLVQETQPLIASWRDTIIKMDRLSWRLRARFISLWVLDIGIPLLLSAVAINKCYGGLILLLNRVFG